MEFKLCFLLPGCVYVHKICDDKFGGFKKLFSWLGQKVNKKIDGSDAYGHDADDWPGLVPMPDASKPFDNRIRSHLFHLTF